jgi:signal transduction histidine kinase
MIGNNLAYAFQVVQQFNPDVPENPVPVELLLDSIARGVIFVSGDGKVASINKYAAEALHVWPETVVGKRVDMLPLNTPLYKVLSEQCRGVPLEMPIMGRIIAAQSTAVRSGSGAACGELIELWDITEEKRSKRQWEEFVTMMTHDLRSPLSVIMGYVQGMQCGMFGEISDRVRSVVEKAEESGKKLNSMIEEMLDNFRMEVGLLNLNRQECDAEKLLEGCYRDNLRTAQKQGIKLVLQLQDGIPHLHVDSRQMARVFNNLIGNAIKYTPDAGEVTITSECGEDALHVSIADTGIGIPPEDLSRIFFKYYRCAGASGFKGTGLGLAISKTIIEAHGGSIKVESSFGSGSRFTVSIPLGFPEEDETDASCGSNYSQE